MRKSLFLVLVWALVCTTGLWAQQQGGAAGGNQGGGQPGGNTGGGRGNTGQQPGGQLPGQGGRQQNDPFGNQQQQRDQMDRSRPVFLSGKVVMDGGTPPPEPAIIERVCNGQTHPESYTDSKGNFSFQLGGDQTLAITDASVASTGHGTGGQFGNDPFGGGDFGNGGGANSLGHVNLSGCELRASLAGYRSDVVQLGRRSVFDNPDVGVIVLHRLDGVVGSAVSATTLAAPKEARKAFDNGIKEMRKKNANVEKAAKELDKAVAAYPQFASAWSAIGQLRLSQNDYPGAQEAFEKALEADDKYLNPYAPLVRLHLMASHWAEAGDLADRALRLNPHMTDMQYFKAISLYNAGKLEDAEKAALAVQETKEGQQFPQTHQILGMIHSQKGNFTGAASEYRTYLAAQPSGAIAEDLKKRLNEWEVLGVIPKTAPAPEGAVTAVKEQ